MIIKKIKIDLLQFDPANARKHDAKNLRAIKGSLAKFGQQKPIVIDKNKVVIAGNGTLEAAKALGWTEIDAVETKLSGAKAIAFSLADNRTAELASWNDQILGKALQALREEDFDIESIGFEIGGDIVPPVTPEPSDAPAKYQLRVEFEDDESREEIFLELRDRGYKVKV
jgi:ParB-like chromosome segregation protein Spo0J